MTSAQRGKNREDRNYLKNMATIHGQEIKFVSDDHAHPNNNDTKPIEKFRYSSDDLNEEQKANLQKITDAALERKRQEFNRGRSV
jgi:hypothetical protein